MGAPTVELTRRRTHIPTKSSRSRAHLTQDHAGSTSEVSVAPGPTDHYPFPTGSSPLTRASLASVPAQQLHVIRGKWRLTETELLQPCSWSGHDDRGGKSTVRICARLEGSSNHFGGCVYGLSPRGPLHAVHWLSCQLSFYFLLLWHYICQLIKPHVICYNLQNVL